MTAARSERPTLVLVTSRLPWPLTHGFAIKNYWLLKMLARRYAVVLHVVTRETPTPDDRAQIRQLCERLHIHRPRLADVVLAAVAGLVRGTTCSTTA